ncbi:hypothetical protein R1flu_026171 [Riccia fluitans]|uniref:Uncharacterized protein n=1 Tax=Riccia fluitans TaxID=41844 RepID=A0ABD1XF76_9MARC
MIMTEEVTEEFFRFVAVDQSVLAITIIRNPRSILCCASPHCKVAVACLAVACEPCLLAVEREDERKSKCSSLVPLASEVELAYTKLVLLNVTELRRQEAQMLRQADSRNKAGFLKRTIPDSAEDSIVLASRVESEKGHSVKNRESYIVGF